MILSDGQTKLGNLYEGCGGQSSIEQNQLNSVRTQDKWNFSVIFQRGFVHPAGHFNIRGTSSNPNDPILTIDPWSNSFTRGK